MNKTINFYKRKLVINIFRTPSQEIKDKITLWLNHLLVIYAFLIPINNNAKSSLFFTMLVLFLYRRDYWFYLKDAFNNKIVQAFLIFYVANVIGLFYTENIEYGMSHMDKAKYLLFPLFFLSFLDVRFAFRIITAFILGMLVAEIFSYLIHFGILPYEFYIGKYEIWETTLGSPAPFLSHIDHNIGLGVVVAVLLYQLLNNKSLNILIKIGTFLFIISATINMSFIASRGGYVLYLVLLFVVFLLTYKKNIIKILLVSCILLSSISYISYTYADTVNKRVNQTIDNVQKIINENNYNSSIGLRIGFTKYSIDTIKENLFFGVGVGDHMDVVKKSLPKEHSYIKEITNPHNTYIQVLLQLGLFGFILFIYLFYTVLSCKVDKYKKNIIIIVTIAVLIFMLPGTFFATFELPLFATFVSALIAIKKYDFKVDNYNFDLFKKYFIIIVLFLIIGITR
ncbi:polymerase [Malaciobacter marinus]|nr:polymerase [Malaciobacter marinus]